MENLIRNFLNEIPIGFPYKNICFKNINLIICIYFGYNLERNQFKYDLTISWSRVSLRLCYYENYPTLLELTDGTYVEYIFAPSYNCFRCFRDHYAAVMCNYEILTFLPFL